MTDIETRDRELHSDVYVTPDIPIESLDLPPGTEQRMWSPISSTLIYGERDAVLVDALLTVAQAPVPCSNDFRAPTLWRRRR
jgi:hypothetical protein